jgi:adenylate kinase
MNILFLGPSGSGKGTQAKLLVEKYGFKYVVMGDLLRAAANSKPEVKEILSQGKLVPTELTFGLVKEAIGGRMENVILDGFPRTLDQYELLKPWLEQTGSKIDLVIVLLVDEEKLINRLSARRLDPITGQIYNLVTDLPPADIDVSKLTQREDDKLEAIEKRLTWYKDSVIPLVDKLKEELDVFEVNGDRSIDEIQAELVKIVEASK